MGVEVRNGLREEQGDGWETKGDQKCTTLTKVLKVGQNQPLREWLEEGDRKALKRRRPMKRSITVLMTPGYSHRIFSYKGRSHCFLYSVFAREES